MDKQILIAGASGTIGSFLCSKLDLNEELIPICSGKGTMDKGFVSVNLNNINDIDSFVKDCPQFDIVIFLVGLAHKKGRKKDLNEFKEINFQTLVNLLSALTKNNKTPNQIIFTSSISVYGNNYENTYYNEESEKYPKSPYAITKLQAENYLLEKYRNISWILRLAPVYSSKFHLNINRRTKLGYFFYRIGNGRVKLSLCNIENIGSSIQAIIDNNVPAGIYIISDSKQYQYNDLLEWKGAKWVIFIPKVIIRIIFSFSKKINNIFLIENTIKLISDNIFSSKKISKYINLNATLDEHIHIDD